MPNRLQSLQIFSSIVSCLFTLSMAFIAVQKLLYVIPFDNFCFDCLCIQGLFQEVLSCLFCKILLTFFSGNFMVSGNRSRYLYHLVYICKGSCFCTLRPNLSNCICWRLSFLPGLISVFLSKITLL